MCLEEIEYPEDIVTLLIKFFGPAFKFMKPSHKEMVVDFKEEDYDLRPIKRQKTDEENYSNS